MCSGQNESKVNTHMYRIKFQIQESKVYVWVTLLWVYLPRSVLGSSFVPHTKTGTPWVKQWVSDLEHFLLLQRTHVQSPAHTQGGSPPPLTLVPADLVCSSGLQGHQHAQSGVHTHLGKKTSITETVILYTKVLKAEVTIRKYVSTKVFQCSRSRMLFFLMDY